MYDLIYAGSKERETMEEAFPQAVFEDASDFVHEERFSISLDISVIEYYEKLLNLGLALDSFTFRLWMHEQPKECEELVGKWKASIKSKGETQC